MTPETWRPSCCSKAGRQGMALGILIGTRLDDRSRRGITCEFKVRELKMVRPAIDPLNDGIGGAFQLVVQTSLHQAAEHGVARIVAMEGKSLRRQARGLPRS
jgi:hypothetical protein